MRRSSLLCAAAILFAVPLPAVASAMAGDGPHGSAHAVSVRTTLLDKPLVTIDPLPAAAYPTGADRSVAEVGPDTAGLLTAKVLNASSQLHDRTLTSRASIAEIEVKDLLRAAIVTAECRTDGSEVTGGSSIAELTVLGHKVDLAAAPDTAINVAGVATVRLNEQIRQDGVLTVNAVHVVVAGPVGHLTSADVVLSQVRCSASGPITEPTTPTTTDTTTATATTSSTTAETSVPATATSSSPQPTGATATTTTTSVLGIVTASNEDDLAQTGATGVVGMALAAAVLLLAGVMAIVFTRRRRSAGGRSTD